MAITRTGVFSEDTVAGNYLYGHTGTGSLLVNGGSQFDMTASNASLEPFLGVGSSGGGDGTVTVTGVGSEINIIANGVASGDGAGANIGINGGTGVVNVTAGGLISVSDPSPGAVTADFSNTEFFNVGRNGGNGTLTVNAGTVQHIGTSSSMNVGRDGGTGTASFSNNSTLTIQNVAANLSPSVTASSLMFVGRGTGGDGTVTFDNSDGSILGGVADAGLRVGRDGGSGIFNLLNGSTFQVNGNGSYNHFGRGIGADGTINIDSSTFSANGSSGGTAFAFGIQGGAGAGTLTNSTITLSSSAFTFLTVGVDAGSTGDLDIDASSVTVSSSSLDATFGTGINSGQGNSTVTGGSTVTLNAVSGFGGVGAGENGGNGTLLVDTSTFDINGGTNGSRFGVGIDVGSIGAATVSNGSDISLSGAGFVGIGVGEGGGSGTLTANGSTLTAASTASGAYFNIGRDAGSVGTASLLNGSMVAIQSDSDDFASVEIGGNDGDGDLLIDDSTVALQGGGAGVFVGDTGGEGTLTIQNGGLLTMNASLPDDFGQLRIGSNGAVGTAVIDGGSVQFTTAAAAILVGTDFGSAGAGNGILVVDDGGLITAENAASLIVGGGSGSQGTVEVIGGGVINLDTVGVDDGWLKVGGTEAGAVGTLTIDGAGSQIIGLNAAWVGRNTFEGEVTAGTGTMNLINGGMVGGGAAFALGIGQGGTLNAHNGSVGGTLLFDNGGTVDMENGLFGTLTMTSGVTILGAGNMLEMDFGAGGNDRVVLGGNVVIDGNLAMNLQAVSGYKLVDGQVLTLVEAAADATETSGDVVVTVNDQHADFSYFLGFTAAAPFDFVLEALNGGATGGNGVFDFGAGASAGGAAVYDSATGVGEIDGGLYADGDVFNVDTFLGTNLADTITVINGDGTGMTLDGRAGNDALVGGADNDILIGGAGADGLSGGLGVDTADYSGSTGGVTVNLQSGTGAFGHAAGDTLTGIENVTGSALADLLIGDALANTLVGGGGNDQIRGGDGADTLAGGDGIDTLSYENSDAGVTVSLAANSVSGGDAAGDAISDFEYATGSGFDDVLLGTVGVNVLSGGDGDDFLQGGLGADGLIGGAGTGDTIAYTSSSVGVTVNLLGNSASGGEADGDTISGIENVTGSGQGDTLIGNGQVNTLSGGLGNDILEGGAGGDALVGGGGSDTASYSTATAGVTVNLDTLTGTDNHAAGDSYSSIENVTGSGFADTLTGDTASNVLTGGGGNDTLVGHGGADALDGGAGSDTVSYAGSNGVTVNLLTGDTLGGHSGGDTFTSIENIGGSDFGDDLTGTTGNNVISGAGGNDGLNGSNGDDQLFGGDGNDQLFGGAGADALDGGGGTDHANYLTSNAAITVNLASGTGSGGHAEGDTLAGIETVTGSNFADTLTGGGDAETLNGGNGADAIIGSLGADRLNGNGGVDTADYSGSGAGVNVNLLSTVGSGAGSFAEGDVLTSIENVIGTGFADRLIGTTGANVLEGGEGADDFNGSLGNDSLFGQGGDDVMVGGQGADAFDGGAGNDWVYYSNSSGGVTANLGAGTGSGSDATGDTFVSIENLYGSTSSDTLTGDANVNTLNGFHGGDTLVGGGGDDLLLGGLGDDDLQGDLGDDFLSGYLGADDFNYPSALFGNDTIIGFEDGIDQIDLTGSGLTFADFTETAAGSGTRLTLTADPGHSILILGVAPGLIDASDFVV